MTAVDAAGNESDPASPEQVTGVDGWVPRSFELRQNTPNPFNPSTEIAYAVPNEGGNVRIAVYDSGGRLVKLLVDQAGTPGWKRVTWNGLDGSGSRVASGIYYCKMEAPGYERTIKLALLK